MGPNLPCIFNVHNCEAAHLRQVLDVTVFVFVDDVIMILFDNNRKHLNKILLLTLTNIL